MTVAMFVVQAQSATSAANPSVWTYSISGLIALASASVAVIGSFWVARYSLNKEREFEIQREKIEAAVAYLASFRDIRIVSLLAREADDNDPASSLSPEQREKMSAARERVFLLMSSEVTRAAENLREAYLKTSEIKDEESVLDYYARTNPKIVEARSAFREAVKRELRVKHF